MKLTETHWRAADFAIRAALAASLAVLAYTQWVELHNQDEAKVRATAYYAPAMSRLNQYADDDRRRHGLPLLPSLPDNPATRESK